MTFDPLEKTVDLAEVSCSQRRKGSGVPRKEE